jgi:hypothetical protein
LPRPTCNPWIAIKTKWRGRSVIISITSVPIHCTPSHTSYSYFMGACTRDGGRWTGGSNMEGQVDFVHHSTQWRSYSPLTGGFLNLCPVAGSLQGGRHLGGVISEVPVPSPADDTPQKGHRAGLSQSRTEASITRSLGFNDDLLANQALFPPSGVVESWDEGCKLHAGTFTRELVVMELL